MTSEKLDPRVIVALDFPTLDETLHFTRALAPGSCRLKVGKELFTAAGPAVLDALQHQGFEVFLDLKYHDIPNTVAKACRVATQLGVWMVDLHTLGGRSMMEAAREAVDAVNGTHKPKLIGVTILTSHSTADIGEIGISSDIPHEVRRLTELAIVCGIDGVVCSAEEATMIRGFAPETFLLVTPGIRPAGASIDDQSRVMTPKVAMEQGASYLVIGRPITRAENPMDVINAINHDIQKT